ncbi:hypothetical protein JCGZ_23764 [Jatropha curcas]|uniref:KAT8 regulatory NSL complex subunit 2 n=1 Tax=Jatropha curcas TaxID=180498 RepID=A0A067L341_JATCU|nr:INO80 complex subunit D [Jatropha curcas]KDP42822.1 hypothetical protein JCGZ_23764 [Jatropha curcas]
MTPASRNLLHHHQPSSARPPKNPNPNTTTAAMTNSQNPKPNPNSSNSVATNSPITLSEQEQFLSRASHLTRPELLKRRSYNLKQLSKCYRDHYWALMEELKIQYKEYYWKYGVSPFKEDHPSVRQKQEQGGGGVVERESGEREGGNVNIEVIGENNNNNNGNNVGSNSKGDFDLKNNHRCLFVGCKLKAMALTSFCHLHILSDAKQKLYKPCGYVIKSAQAGPITCGKPILRSTAPSLCSVHFQKAQKHVTRALKKAGLNVSSSSKLAPKFHVIVAEYVRQIQAKRKAAERGNRIKGLDKEASAS